MKLEFYGQIYEKYSNTKFHKNPPIGRRVVPCAQTDRRTDMTKLRVAFRSSANAPRVLLHWETSCSLCADRQTDRHDEAKSRFS